MQIITIIGVTFKILNHDNYNFRQAVTISNFCVIKNVLILLASAFMSMFSVHTVLDASYISIVLQ